jgi:macro domain-containing protein
MQSFLSTVFRNAGLQSHASVLSIGPSLSVGVAIVSATSIPCDALVVPHVKDYPDMALLGPFGFGPAVRKAGGTAGLREYHDTVLKRLLLGTRQKLGDVLLTKSGEAPARHLIHAVVHWHSLDEGYQGSNVKTKDIIQKAAIRSMELAQRTGLDFVVFPAFTVNAFLPASSREDASPHDIAARALLAGIRTFAKGPDNIPSNVLIAIRPPGDDDWLSRRPDGHGKKNHDIHRQEHIYETYLSVLRRTL